MVEYVRMSTEHQQYSIDNQMAVIRRYAEEHNMDVVRTYSDAARSGLTIRQRSGLQQLIKDVESGEPDFSAILVYDVSRWGRFLDIDESAYYEYRCRRAGIDVHYCAEPFLNDGSISSDLLKALKRAMAREYSRELSAKVFAGKCRLVELGFRQGGHAGYGLRRLLIDADRRPKGYLKWGEKKSILTDRVILVPGPPEEIAVVREVFRLFSEEQMIPEAIAARLNARGVLNEQGRPWSRFTIDDMVTNPKYIGTNVTHRTSFKLRTKLVRNPPDLWVRREKAFEGIIEPDIFARAAVVRATRTKRYSDEELLDRLRGILLALSRCRDRDARGNDHWTLNLTSKLKPDLTVVIRMGPGNEKPLDYFLIPRIAALPSPQISCPLDSVRDDQRQEFESGHSGPQVASRAAV